MKSSCFIIAITMLAPIWLSGCVSFGGGGEIQDSGPTRAVDLSHVPDAVPRTETRTIAGNKTPYTVLGKTYQVMMDVEKYQKQGIASWYGRKFHGRNTANGEVYDMYAMTAAHKTLPIPSYVRVTNLENGKEVTVRVNDRGPFHGDRIIDLSYAAASKLEFANKGTALVLVTLINPKEPLAGAGHAIIQNNNFETFNIANSIDTPVGTVSASITLTPANKTLVAATAIAETGNMFVQVGAFSSEASAIGLKDRLSALVNYPVFIDSMDVVNNLFKVRIGPIINDLELVNIKKIMVDHNLGVPHLVRD